MEYGHSHFTTIIRLLVLMKNVVVVVTVHLYAREAVESVPPRTGYVSTVTNKSLSLGASTRGHGGDLEYALHAVLIFAAPQKI
eukprot:1461992-Pleurochrysis_carterae.AAC.1